MDIRKVQTPEGLRKSWFQEQSNPPDPYQGNQYQVAKQGTGNSNRLSNGASLDVNREQVHYKNKCWSTLKRVLEWISLGQYPTKLYETHGDGYQSSWIGGVFTIVCTIVVAAISITIILSTVRKENVYVTERAASFNDSPFANMTMLQLTNLGLKLPYFQARLGDGGAVCLSYNDKHKTQKGYCYNQNLPSDQWYTFGLELNETRDYYQTSYGGVSNLREMKDFLLNADPRNINDKFPALYYYKVTNWQDFSIFQGINEMVGGESAVSSLDRIQLSYDDYSVYVTVKLIHLVDNTDFDFVNFGNAILSQFFGWLFGVNFDQRQENQVGTLYVSKDYKIWTWRKNVTDDLQVTTFINPVYLEQTKHCGTPIEAIAKIGGLLFVLRVSFLIRFLHEYYFERKMRQKYQRKHIEEQRQRQVNNINDTLYQTAQVEDDVFHTKERSVAINNDYFMEMFSFENFKKLLDRVSALEQEKSAKYEEFSQVRQTMNEKLESQVAFSEAQHQYILRLKSQNDRMEQVINGYEDKLRRQDQKIQEIQGNIEEYKKNV